MFTGHETHDIPLADAAAMTKIYRQSVPTGSRKGGFFSRDAIESILADATCMGIRYYHGINNKGEPVIILVGADANEDDITAGALLEFAIPCPNQCGSNNALNS
jgi:hypothetical protein